MHSSSAAAVAAAEVATSSNNCKPRPFSSPPACCNTKAAYCCDCAPHVSSTPSSGQETREASTSAVSGTASKFKSKFTSVVREISDEVARMPA